MRVEVTDKLPPKQRWVGRGGGGGRWSNRLLLISPFFLRTKMKVCVGGGGGIQEVITDISHLTEMTDLGDMVCYH